MVAAQGTERPCVLLIEPDAFAVEAERELAQDFEVLVARDFHGAVELIEAREADLRAVVSGLLVPAGAGFYRPPRLLWLRVPFAARIVVSPEPEAASHVAAALAGAVLQTPWTAGGLVSVVRWAMSQPIVPLSLPRLDVEG